MQPQPPEDAGGSAQVGNTTVQFDRPPSFTGKAADSVADVWGLGSTTPPPPPRPRETEEEMVFKSANTQPPTKAKSAPIVARSSPRPAPHSFYSSAPASLRPGTVMEANNEPKVEVHFDFSSPKGFPLKYTTIPVPKYSSSAYTCDVCHMTKPFSKGVWHSPQDDFDLCPLCASRMKQREVERTDTSPLNSPRRAIDNTSPPPIHGAPPTRSRVLQTEGNLTALVDRSAGGLSPRSVRPLSPRDASTLHGGNTSRMDTLKIRTPSGHLAEYTSEAPGKYKEGRYQCDRCDEILFFKNGAFHAPQADFDLCPPCAARVCRGGESRRSPRCSRGHSRERDKEGRRSSRRHKRSCSRGRRCEDPTLHFGPLLTDPCRTLAVKEDPCNPCRIPPAVCGPGESLLYFRKPCRGDKWY
uniref:Uncharacterized protein n=1 Tax=Chromera velia CCMP2878 TaxID=1169474 RepID=A0A0G4HUX2_9ALVE|eukprot:Cvel_8756.t1-p1 / transcript=Cvel_8756.t1 / gene=Cvel_8756 / organism=Chromera_velia_CCMP2878 / gene_product=hypothetical protein / transcript_product=hypothetical protein / location=Cvel_scaffold489:76881-79664(-) / protein_length=411 / sequence_SO=supercontig / SO=protein_coding / is_pseudo=false